MSIAGILSSSLFNNNTQNVQNTNQQFREEFLQLGQDLQSGNLTAAQSDLSTLRQLQPQSTTSTESGSPISQEFTQLSSDLKAGKLSAAQQDYATIRQDMQNRAVHGHHHRIGAGNQETDTTQLLRQLGQALQSGNIANAPQAYSALFADLQLNGGISATLAMPQSGLNSIFGSRLEAGRRKSLG